MRRSILITGAAVLAITHAVRAVELFNNGTFVTGTSPGGNTISELQAGYDTFGLVAGGYNPVAAQRVSDNFVIALGDGGFDLDHLKIYAYQTGGVVNGFTAAYVGVFDFDPTGTTNLAPRYGSLDPFTAPNGFVSQAPTNIFRVGANLEDTSRHVHEVVIDLSFLPVLEPGEWWFAVGLRGTTDAATVAVVPVVPAPATADALAWGRTRYATVGREDFWQYADGDITGPDTALIEPYDYAFNLDGTNVAINQWNQNVGGAYSNAANWSQNMVPNGVDAVAHFGGAISLGDATITVASPITLGKLNFNTQDFSYTIAGAGPITMQGSAGGANINAIRGSHTINTPLVVPGNLGLFVQQTNAVLAINSGIDAPSGTIVKRGGGTAVANYVRSNSLEIRAGTLRIAPNGTSAGTSNVKRLVMDRLLGTARGKLNITNNALVVDYDGFEPSPIENIRSLIVEAYNDGMWNGNGIMSSDANASQFGIGYAEANELGSIPAIFGTVDADAVLVRLTRYGDATLDGIVDLSDFNRLAANFGSTDADWFDGDFTFDRVVDLSDFNRLAGNFGLSAGLDGPTPDDWAALASAVPEPAATLLLGFIPIVLHRRRRRVS